MMRYNCKVKLTSTASGAPSVHEVRKSGITAAEVLVLRALHGDDSVIDIVPIVNDRTPHAEERAYLEQRYGRGLMGAKTSMALLFGQHGNLPGKLADVEGDAPDEGAEDRKAA